MKWNTNWDNDWESNKDDSLNIDSFSDTKKKVENPDPKVNISRNIKGIQILRPDEIPDEYKHLLEDNNNNSIPDGFEKINPNIEQELRNGSFNVLNFFPRKIRVLITILVMVFIAVTVLPTIIFTILNIINLF